MQLWGWKYERRGINKLHSVQKLWKISEGTSAAKKIFLNTTFSQIFTKLSSLSITFQRTQNIIHEHPFSIVGEVLEGEQEIMTFFIK